MAVQQMEKHFVILIQTDSKAEPTNFQNGRFTLSSNLLRKILSGSQFQQNKVSEI